MKKVLYLQFQKKCFILVLACVSIKISLVLKKNPTKFEIYVSCVFGGIVLSKHVCLKTHVSRVLIIFFKLILSQAKTTINFYFFLKSRL